MATHQFHHHTRISWFHGMTFLAFSSSGTNEDQGGQQCAISFSSNRGLTWSTPPTQVIPSQSEWTDIHTDDGQRITYPRNFTLYNGTNYLTCAVDFRTNGGYRHGAALISCPVFTDGTIGSIFRISTNSYPSTDGKAVPSYDSVLGPPLLLDSAELFGCWGGTAPGGGSSSDWVGWKFDGVSTWVEPNVFPLDILGQNFIKLWRETGIAFGKTNVGLSWSTNRGVTWTNPIDISQIPNAPSETAGLMLIDGRYAIIGNAVNHFPVIRDPLFLAITAMGGTAITNVSAIRQGVGATPVYPGFAKEGGAQYPGACQVGNYLYVSYSLQKENVGFSRVLIPGLADNNNDIYVNTITTRVTNARSGLP
jgi:hypothetical protein